MPHPLARTVPVVLEGLLLLAGEVITMFLRYDSGGEFRALCKMRFGMGLHFARKPEC